ncbi:LytTR family DNA-binding domain-containing protein [Gramella sp. AN32]|uniref:LytR/AlgR family response regulator transcription factor n=1 Tax=Christiangramia antarctica TaxID=2058158 RepID=A0ABW5XA02_9FLAO|nr:LytTR family DNA-binding domain-containing protein [Gramella sp. AN32]MCM4157549.1 DNA-binding response regulator [Gramella sp. AN32]
MKCIIVDDEQLPAKILETLIKDQKKLELLGIFHEAMEAIKFLNEHQEVDLIFLDILMPGFSGFDFIKTIKSKPQIILISSDKNFAFKAFEFEEVVDYLNKPVQPERFKVAISRAEKNHRIRDKVIHSSRTNAETLENNKLCVNVNRRLVNLDINSIYAIEAKGDYILVKTDKENHVVYSTLKKIFQKLPSDKFIQVHRSFIVNFNEIIDIKDNSVLVKSDLIPVSRSHRTNLINKLNLL